MGDIPAGIGRKLADLFRDRADIAVRDLAEAVLERARRDAPPPPGKCDPDPSVSLSTGGRVERVRAGVYDIVFDEPYAAKQHEAMGFKHPNGGGSKYLEKNVLLAARELEGAIASGVRAVTTRGGSGTTRISTKRF